MRNVKIWGKIFLLLIVILVIGSAIITIVFKQIKKNREAYFSSLLSCVYSAENEKNNEYSTVTNLSELLSKYTDEKFEKSLNKVYFEIPHFLNAPKIHYIPRDKLYEDKDYPTSIFSKDRLEISTLNSQLRWVRSGEVVMTMNEARIRRDTITE